MKVVHDGYTITGMVSGIAAEIIDKSNYVEIVLTDGEHRRRFDLDGLRTFIRDLTQVHVLAEKVESCNAPDREVPQ